MALWSYPLNITLCDAPMNKMSFFKYTNAIVVLEGLSGERDEIEGDGDLRSKSG